MEKLCHFSLVTEKLTVRGVFASSLFCQLRRASQKVEVRSRGRRRRERQREAR